MTQTVIPNNLHFMFRVIKEGYILNTVSQYW